eukprot:TRINITY_DN9761_c0_g1_i1.p1 TRINITY_DN9761_c0_g1~~TRINITY_DN9761_c0_g1_i1.p1  ORF type:complete len:519 (+),score=48.18 TRINITY_DN9761_c0_g1_i1:82-1638(+)
MTAPRYFPRRYEVLFHAGLVFYLVVLQWDILRDLSVKYKDFLPLRGSVDLTDTQWKDFRAGLGPLTIAMVIFVAISQCFRRFLGRGAHTGFYLLSGVGFVAYVHGAYAVFPLSLAVMFYSLAHLCKRFAYGRSVIWMTAIAVLYISDSNGGWYKANLPFFDDFFKANQGLYRWHVGFNLTMLKILSFSLDLNEFYKKTPVNPHSPCAECSKGDTPCYSLRVNTPRQEAEYGVVMYLAYVFYVPLYIAGPTTTFNAFASHVEVPQRSLGLRYILMYTWRWVVVFLMLEVGLNHVYVWALLKSQLVRRVLSPMEFAVLGFWLLNALWLKFAVIWRFFRLAALSDGVEVLENLSRCVNDNYTIAGFWRNWHRSFNKWLVRYMYIPLGGSKTQTWNVFPIFLFVAFWHDLELHLLKWGLLMAVFIIPETLLTSRFASPSMSWLRSKPYYRYLKAIAGTFNITILMTANLIGFGSLHTAGDLTSYSSISWVVFFGFIEFFSATSIMIEVREYEAEQEERLKVS